MILSSQKKLRGDCTHFSGGRTDGTIYNFDEDDATSTAIIAAAGFTIVTVRSTTCLSYPGRATIDKACLFNLPDAAAILDHCPQTARLV